MPRCSCAAWSRAGGQRSRQARERSTWTAISIGKGSLEAPDDGQRARVQRLGRGSRSWRRPEVAVTLKSAVNNPSRITKSKEVGALFGVTPKKYQSGEKDVTGGVTPAGGQNGRTTAQISGTHPIL